MRLRCCRMHKNGKQAVLNPKCHPPVVERFWNEREYPKHNRTNGPHHTAAGVMTISMHRRRISLFKVKSITFERLNEAETSQLFEQCVGIGRGFEHSPAAGRFALKRFFVGVDGYEC